MSTGGKMRTGNIILAELKHTYFAGNQNEFRSPRIASYGCGLIGFADLLLYLMEQDWRTGGAGGFATRGGKKYEEFISRLDRSFARVYSHIGLNGFSMAIAFNRRARRRGWPYRARWAIPRKRLPETICEMLENDIPVILSVGPGFHDRKGEHGVALYRNGRRTEVRARDHYVTVIGYEEDPESGERSFRIVSWGKEYRISASEYLNGSTGSIPFLGNLFSNVLYIRKTG